VRKIRYIGKTVLFNKDKALFINKCNEMTERFLKISVKTIAEKRSNGAQGFYHTFKYKKIKFFANIVCGCSAVEHALNPTFLRVKVGRIAKLPYFPALICDEHYLLALCLGVNSIQ
jgi:hypothetical protein